MLEGVSKMLPRWLGHYWSQCECALRIPFVDSLLTWKSSANEMAVPFYWHDLEADAKVRDTLILRSNERSSPEQREGEQGDGEGVADQPRIRRGRREW
jgi:hypothetical protein